MSGEQALGGFGGGSREDIKYITMVLQIASQLDNTGPHLEAHVGW